MLGFGTKKRQEHLNAQEQLKKTVSLEIQTHKDTSAKTIAKTKKIADNFDRIVNENGFSFTIHVATKRNE